MSTRNRILILSIMILGLCTSHVSPTYASDALNSPTVESLTGTTTGIVGTGYAFSTIITATEAYPILDGYIFVNSSLTDRLENRSLVASEGARTGTNPNCTSTSCTISGTFTPTSAGTYYISVSANYNNGTGDTSCTTHPAETVVCTSSADKYITFVVTEGTSGEDDTLPSAGILSNQTRNIFIGLGFIFLGILTTQTSKILDTLGLSREKIAVNRRSKFEKKF